MTQNTNKTLMDCLLMELAPNQDDLTEPFVKYFGKKRFIPLHTIIDLDKEEVCCFTYFN